MRTRAGVELALALAAAPAVFALAAAVDLHEQFTTLTQRLERWQVDEAVFALLAACVALTTFALRRWREAQAELRAREQAERALGELGQRHRELAHRVIELQESERRHLAREVHDHLGQTCVAIRVEAAALLERAEDAAARAGLRRIGASADVLYEGCHDLLAVLQPPELESGGLPAALQALVESWEPAARVTCLFYPVGDFDGLDPATALALYRIAQESLSNVVRHARATRVVLRLERVGGGSGAAGAIRLRIEDDGIGRRRAAAARPAGDTRRGLGLVGMQERASMVGGRIAFHDLDPHGFAIDCNIPFAVARPVSAHGAGRDAATVRQSARP